MNPMNQNSSFPLVVLRVKQMFWGWNYLFPCYHSMVFHHHYIKEPYLQLLTVYRVVNWLNRVEGKRKEGGWMVEAKQGTYLSCLKKCKQEFVQSTLKCYLSPPICWPTVRKNSQLSILPLSTLICTTTASFTTSEN